jgi:energy-converting hydrogenase Eha subunit H
MFHPTPHKYSAMVFWPVVRSTQTNKEKTKQNVKNKNKAKIIIHTLTVRGIVNVEKIYCDFFSTDATHTYDIYIYILYLPPLGE